jgi:hypothetical protein
MKQIKLINIPLIITLVKLIIKIFKVLRIFSDTLIKKIPSFK